MKITRATTAITITRLSPEVKKKNGNIRMPPPSGGMLAKKTIKKPIRIKIMPAGNSLSKRIIVLLFYNNSPPKNVGLLIHLR